MLRKQLKKNHSALMPTNTVHRIQSGHLQLVPTPSSQAAHILQCLIVLDLKYHHQLKICCGPNT